MKKVLLALTLLVSIGLTSCSSIGEAGTIYLENGEGTKVATDYTISNVKIEGTNHTSLDYIVSHLTSDEFETIVNEASKSAERTCKYQPTYEPSRLTVFMMGDTITVGVRFTAKNAFGVKGANTTYARFKGTTLIDNHTF